MDRFSHRRSRLDQSPTGSLGKVFAKMGQLEPLAGCWCVFFEQETTQGYFEALYLALQRQGVLLPLCCWRYTATGIPSSPNMTRKKMTNPGNLSAPTCIWRSSPSTPRARIPKGGGSAVSDTARPAGQGHAAGGHQQPKGDICTLDRMRASLLWVDNLDRSI